MTELALVSVLHSRRKSNSYVLAGDDTQAGYVWNECWLDADLADSNWAGSKLSKNMGWFRRNEGNDPVRENRVVSPFVHRSLAVWVDAGGHIHGDDCSECVIRWLPPLSSPDLRAEV